MYFTSYGKSQHTWYIVYENFILICVLKYRMEQHSHNKHCNNGIGNIYDIGKF